MDLMDDYIERLLETAQHLTEDTLFTLDDENVRDICRLTRNEVLTEPMLVEVTAPVVVVADIHGQYTDLLRIFSRLGHPNDCCYLFLGDYVDRGPHSLEVICLLFAYKARYRNRITLLRGNHESALLNREYTFYTECRRRATTRIWRAITDVFDYLPVAALVDNRVFCVHGGLSPDLDSYDSIRALDRPTEVPDQGLMCDLLWSDPEPGQRGYAFNTMRRISYIFGEDAVTDFIRRFRLTLIVRAHQPVDNGFEYFAGNQLVTLFTAPGYEHNNTGAVLHLDEDLQQEFIFFQPQPVVRDRRRKVPEPIARPRNRDRRRGGQE